MQIKLAEALLRRKELQQKVQQLHTIKNNQSLYQMTGQRVKVMEGIDEITATFPKLNVSQVTVEYDFYARQLRLIDGAIQHANWTCEVTADGSVMQDYKAE